MAVLRQDSAEDCRQLAHRLAESGMRALEVALTTPGALEVIAELAREDGLTVGAGTALTPEQVRLAARAGARFVVSPVVAPELMGIADVEVILGASTPTEVQAARRAGCDIVKLFPIKELGGPGFLRALRGPFPGLRAFPTGGIRPEDVAAYLEAGAVVVGVGGALAPRRATPEALERAAEAARLLAAQIG